MKVNLSKPPLFSIITVCLNESFVEETCRSIVEQTFNDFEWIVIDGGSNKETLDMLEAYRWRMDYFVSEPDGGVYHAMNKGIEQARGDYLIFMNGGDSFAARHILQIAHEELATKATVDVLYGEINMPFKDGDNWVSSTPSEANVEKALFIGTIRHQASFIHRRCFEKYGKYDITQKIVSDWKFFVTLQRNGAIFLRWNCIVANCSPFGISTDRERARLERKRGMDEIYSRPEQAILYKKFMFDRLRSNFNKYTYYVR